MFSLASGAVTWNSKKKDIVALSTTEAEYIAATASACQAVWLGRLLCEFRQEQIRATTLYCDNKSSIAIAKNPMLHGRTMHIEIRFHFIRMLILDGLIKLEYCNTCDQVADIMTKALFVQKNIYCRTLLGVCSFQSRGSVGILLEAEVCVLVCEYRCQPMWNL